MRKFKVKKIWKNIIFLILIPFTILFTQPTFVKFEPYKEEIRSNKNMNSLIFNDEKTTGFDQLKIQNFSMDETYDLYVNENNFKTISKKFFDFVFKNNSEFYYDSFSKLSKINRIYENKYWIHIFNGFKEIDENTTLMKLTYEIRYGTKHYVIIRDWNYMNSLQMLKTSNYYFPSFVLKIEYGHKWESASIGESNITKPVEFKTVDYNDPIINQSWYTSYDILGYENVTFSFKNVRFHIVHKTIISKNLDKNTLNLREEDIKPYFKINNIYPSKIEHRIEENKLNKLKLTLTNIKYEIKTKNQSLSFEYFGELIYIFSYKYISINEKLVTEKLNLLSINKDTILNDLFIDKDILNLIKDVEIEKDFYRNSARLSILFNELYIKELIFFPIIKDDFCNKDIIIDFSSNGYNIKKSHETTKKKLLENFNLEKDLHFYFENKKGEIFIEEYKVIKNSINSIELELSLKISIGNEKEVINYKTLINDFLYYDFSNIERYINDNFYDSSNIFATDKFIDFINVGNNWINFGIKSDMLDVKVSNLEIRDGHIFLEYELLNIDKEILKKEHIEIQQKEPSFNEQVDEDENNEDRNDQEKNLEYKWLYILVIFPVLFIFFGLIKLVKKIKNDKNN